MVFLKKQRYNIRVFDWVIYRIYSYISHRTKKKIKFSIKDLFSKCNQSCISQRIWSHLLRKSLMENFILLFSKSSSSIIVLLLITKLCALCQFSLNVFGILIPFRNNFLVSTSDFTKNFNVKIFKNVSTIVAFYWWNLFADNYSFCRKTLPM